MENNKKYLSETLFVKDAVFNYTASDEAKLERFKHDLVNSLPFCFNSFYKQKEATKFYEYIAILYGEHWEDQGKDLVVNVPYLQTLRDLPPDKYFQKLESLKLFGNTTSRLMGYDYETATKKYKEMMKDQEKNK